MDGECPVLFKHPMFLHSYTIAVLEDTFFSVRTEIPVEGADGVFFSWTSQIRCPCRIKRQKSEEGCNDLINKNIYFFAKGMHTMHRSVIYPAVQCLAYRSLK